MNNDLLPSKLDSAIGDYIYRHVVQSTGRWIFNKVNVDFRYRSSIYFQPVSTEREFEFHITGPTLS